MTAVEASGRSVPWGRVAVASAFLVAFLWQVLGAVSNLLVWVGFAATLRQQLSAFAWVVLLVGIVVPVVVFAAGLVTGRRLRAGGLALVLLAALAASQALTLSQYAFFLQGVGAL